jgi:superfamily II DNA or RNA helicase
VNDPADWEILARAAGRRTLGLALASDLHYVQPPMRSSGGVRAALGHDGVDAELLRRELLRPDLLRPDLLRPELLRPHRARSSLFGDDAFGRRAPAASGAFHVELRVGGGHGALAGGCSHCAQVFGPCVHVTILAVDLCRSAPLRSALFGGQSTAEAAARAPGVRAALRAELDFDRALAAWVSPSADALAVEIAASPFAEGEVDVGRAYGDRREETHAPSLSVVVRRAGERKLLAAREITPPLRFGGRDRRVLEHTRDRGTGRKAAYAVGTDASLVIEAMRAHGGIFAAGYKGLLDFRSSVVRPTLALGRAGGAGPRDGGAGEDTGEDAGVEAPSIDALTAFWAADDGATRIAFEDSVFFPGPFGYVWTRAGAIYPVARDVDPDFARQLAEAPVLLVPLGKLQDAGARLLRATRGRGVVLPTHEAFGLPPLETPRMVLRLAGEPLDITGELVAIYRARTVCLVGSDFAGAPPGGVSEDGRDLEYEVRARRHVERAGLVSRGPGDEGLPVERLALAGEEAVIFWQSGLVALRAADDPRVEVELSERLARVRVGPPLSGRVHIALEGDWLDTRLAFASADLPVELDAIRAALARKHRWVALSDGTLSRISAAIESLADEAAEVMDSEAHARLPVHQLGRLDRWIEENDGTVDARVEVLRRRLRALAVAAEPDMPRGFRATLRPYQRLGLAWLQFLQALGAGGILADDMGLGKTIMALAFLLRRKQSEGAAPNLVVCPTSVATNWLREAKRFAPGLRMLLLHGPARDPGAITRHDIVVTTYALLRRDLDVLRAIRFRCVVLDEAQNIKNADSATARAANRLDASMRLALSGTPVENRLRELWSLSSFVNPGILGTSRAFETRFERPIATDRTSPVAAELRAIVRPFLLRRTKDDVLPDLPPKIEVDRVVTLHDSDKRMYDALAHTLRASVARDIEKRGMGQSSLSVFTALTRLRQMACDPRLVDASLGVTAGAGPSAKRGAFLDLVRELVAEGRRALVFSQFVQLLTLWRRDLDAEEIAYEYLDGSTTRRDEAIARFQDGTAPLFLISLKAGGAGLNLTAADTVIHCDPWWNPAVEDQATDRAHRIGQAKQVTVVRLIARGTIEEKILSLKAKKRELTKAVIGDDARALEGLTEEDVRTLLGDAADEGDDDTTDRDAADAPPRASPADALATARRVLDPEFHVLVEQAREWLATTGRPEAQLAATVDIPTAYAARLARGEPFPCSRAVADRIRRNLRAY